MNEKFFEGRLTVKVGDITQEDADAIVNAANRSLLGGGGVDGAIHDAGGPAILDECEALRKSDYPDGLPTGKAVATTAGRMRARCVIHTVGPIYGRHQGKEAELLADCYRNSIELAVEKGLKTIAFPAISTGIYGYPRDEAAKVVYAVVTEKLDTHPELEVRLVFFSNSDAASFLMNVTLSSCITVEPEPRLPAGAKFRKIESGLR